MLRAVAVPVLHGDDMGLMGGLLRALHISRPGDEMRRERSIRDAEAAQRTARDTVDYMLRLAMLDRQARVEGSDGVGRGAD